MREFELHRSFTGGVKLVARKRMSTSQKIDRDLEPTRLIIPMTQQSGPAAEPVVKPGQTVRRGQVVGTPTEPPAAAVHAARAGTVTAVTQRAVPGGNQLINTDCVVVDVGEHSGDGVVESAWPLGRSARLEAVRDAGIVGLGGAAFPTSAKLRNELPCELLILNGAECEPYISCDDVLMREHAAAIVSGAATMLDILGANECVVAIERDKPIAIQSISDAIDAAGDDRFSVAACPRYTRPAASGSSSRFSRARKSRAVAIRSPLAASARTSERHSRCTGWHRAASRSCRES
jgi:electron transport complex protein RnfC